jgi:DNA-binding transcriptional LysR family regulator
MRSVRSRFSAVADAFRPAVLAFGDEAFPEAEFGGDHHMLWWRCVSGRTSAWQWLARPRISKVEHDRARRRTLPSIAASIFGCRLPGGLYACEFEKGGRDLRVRVEGQLVFNTATMAVKAALADAGLAFVPEDRVREQIREGSLVWLLSDWCPAFSGFHLYYPSRRQPTPAFALLVDKLRYREARQTMLKS